MNISRLFVGFLTLSCMSCSSHVTDDHALHYVNRYPIAAPSQDALEGWAAEVSLGGKICVQTVTVDGVEILVLQTFPYSGLKASDLYAYFRGDENYRFLANFSLRDNYEVDITSNSDSRTIVVLNPHSNEPILTFSVSALNLR